MVLAIDTVPSEVSPNLPPEVLVPNDTNLEKDVLLSNEQMQDLSSQNKEKKLRLEQAFYKNQALVTLHGEFKWECYNKTHKGLER